MLGGLSNDDARSQAFAPGIVLLGAFARSVDRDLLAALSGIAMELPFHGLTTRCGWRVRAAVTNCGSVGWLADQTGYRYVAEDPEGGQSGPAMPPVLLDVATRAAGRAGFPDFRPDACLISRYAPGSRLPLHQASRPQDVEPPVVCVSLGLPAIFLWDGMTRSEQPRYMRLAHGDVVVWGGEEQMTFHHVDRKREGDRSASEKSRYNFMLRFTCEHGRAASEPS
ncbi:MAG: alpha-ketoglutarate-dependent dioxygenase AlkB [Pseudomonadota bacterium]